MITYVRPYVDTFMRKRDFLGPKLRYCSDFSVHIYLTYEHLFYNKKICPSVCRSGYIKQKYKNIETSISRRLFKIEL